jgi:hypothetical protein
MITLRGLFGDQPAAQPLPFTEDATFAVFIAGGIGSGQSGA